MYNARHPPKQFAWDHTKKTIAILGSGWAATSILKDIDTENYNIVSCSLSHTGWQSLNLSVHRLLSVPEITFFSHHYCQGEPFLGVPTETSSNKMISCTVGTMELRSIMMPIRYITRFKKREVLFVEGECNEIDPEKKTILVEGTLNIFLQV